MGVTSQAVDDSKTSDFKNYSKNNDTNNFTTRVNFIKTAPNERKKCIL